METNWNNQLSINLKFWTQSGCGYLRFGDVPTRSGQSRDILQKSRHVWSCSEKTVRQNFLILWSLSEYYLNKTQKQWHFCNRPSSVSLGSLSSSRKMSRLLPKRRGWNWSPRSPGAPSSIGNPSKSVACVILTFWYAWKSSRPPKSRFPKSRCPDFVPT